MNEELTDNILKTIDQNDTISKNPFNNESEIISHYIIEKLISLTFSNIFKKEVEKKIADYCCIDLIEILNDIKDLEFINHDKDDLIKKHTLLDYISKTPKKSKNKYKNILTLNGNEKKKLNNSQIIKRYKLIKEFDPNNPDYCSINIKPLLPLAEQCFYDLKEENIVMGILKRKNINESKEESNKKIKNNNNNNNGRKKIRNSNKEEPFKINNSEQIGNIEKIESIKIDNIQMSINKNNSNIILTPENNNPNFWSFIPQPKHVIIDRNASTKVKIENNQSKALIVENNNNENNEKSNNKIIKNVDNTKVKKIKKTLNKKSYNNVRDNDNSLKKTKRIIIPIEFPSYDIEPDKSNREEESKEIQQMRKIVEIGINKRKLEELKEQKEKEIEKKGKNSSKIKKQFINANITVDIKGNVVFIKPIRIESLINEFKSMRSNSKDIGRIKDETYEKKSFKNIKVEKNMPEISEQNEKPIKKSRNSSKTNNSKNDNQSNKNKIQTTKIEKNKTPDREGMKFAAGSNFEIINLECGVNLIENKQRRTGGKDYYTKYGRCSFEIFQDQLNKTSSSFYGLDNNLINVNIKEERNLMKTDMGLPPVKKKKLNRGKSEFEIKNAENNANNVINIKTKNLKLALNNLDLINEKKLKELSENNLENKKIDILKNNNMKDKKDKKDLGAINIFNKTLMKTKLWGDPSESFQNQYMARKFPIKPQHKYTVKGNYKNELYYLNQSPRRRLPPIPSYMKSFEEQANKTESGNLSFNKKSKIKLKELKNLKNKNLSKDSLYEDRKKNNLSSTSGFYNNTEGYNFSIAKNDEI